MRSFLLALQFLTRYPVAISGGVELTERDLGRATRYFPLAGLMVGLDLLLMRFLMLWVGALVAWPLACAALLLAYWTWACDSLHLDGAADTADGLASQRTGEEMLEVMHDSRSGAFGVQVTVILLLLKFSYLASLPLRLWWALPLPLIFSRLLASLLCQSRPYAGRLGSLSAWFIAGSKHGDGSAAIRWAFTAFALVSGTAILLGFATTDGAFRALGVCLSAMLLGYALVQVPRRRLGGISGDLIGYGLQACEVCACLGLLFVGL